VLEHTDGTSLALLKAFISQNLTVNDVVTKVMKEVGPDKACESKLEYCPIEAGDVTVDPIFWLVLLLKAGKPDCSGRLI
jgi:hypothetical protein